MWLKIRRHGWAHSVANWEGEIISTELDGVFSTYPKTATCIECGKRFPVPPIGDIAHMAKPATGGGDS